MGTSQKYKTQTSETTNVKYRNARSTCAQVIATLFQNCLLIDIGLELAMPTLVLGALHRSSTDELSMNDDQASWFGSVSSFAHPIGSLASGFLQERFGRKGGMVFINIPIFLAWLTLHFANSITALYVVSITFGLCIGLSEAPLHSYIGEIAEPRLRGSLSTFSTSACSVGLLLMFIIGLLVDWRTAALICSAMPAVTFICMLQIPESPTWLIARNRLEDAQKALCWLRGWVKPEDVEQEFQELVEYTKNSTMKSRGGSSETIQTNGNEVPLVEEQGSYLRTKFRQMTDKRILRPLRLVFITFIISMGTGMGAFKPYLIGIFNRFGLSIDSKVFLVFSQVSFFMAAMVNVVFLRRFGKRKIALLSHSVAAASILLLGVYCSFFQGSNLYPNLVWTPVVLIMIIFFFNGFSITLLPWQLMCEVFPPIGRGTASGISAAWAHFVAFTMVKSFLYAEAAIQLSGVLYFYGALAVLGLIYHYFYLPETEGKTLEQIESYFTKDHDRKEKFSIGKSN